MLLFMINPREILCSSCTYQHNKFEYFPCRK
uniref:Uncharacterized protein n=1 Tax=Anguilla anguilla TaxID=7936 RepID=A0A0E9RJY0_ANGAN